ncbi:hypothetical protein RUM43_009530 [Polyplax serrata]|uniref:PPM-type phosphatase domain-containing protein n=1 Tax=Polyplax serrata TaxID=468196 RepID=A0AAN8PIJ9_POLSC
MEDEFEDRVLYQTYTSHMKLLSKYGVGLPLNSTFIECIWRILRLYVVRAETVLISTILCMAFVYLRTLDTWSRGLYSRLLFTMDKPKSMAGVGLGKPYGGQTWELKEGNIGVYAIQGRRPKMEDRFVISEDINDTGISLFAVFDGHGGEFAANHAKDVLIKNLKERLVEVKKYKENNNINTYSHTPNKEADSEKKGKVEKLDDSHDLSMKKASFRKKTSSTDENLEKSGNIVPDPYFQKLLDSLPRPISRTVRPTIEKTQPQKVSLQSYLDNSKFSGIDYGKIITHEVLAADSMLIEEAKKNQDISGTTALIALLEGSHLVVANVGDSRGVMCDSKGNVIPLSFDHKPQQLKESKRIREAGGFIIFNGVWRVGGILATSRALGDYPLKYNKYVIADPDVLTFDLSDHKPQFIILASDGLWDTFSNEEAVAFIKEHLNEPHFGAKSITFLSYNRGSQDNITVLVINLKDKIWSSHTIKQK